MSTVLRWFAIAAIVVIALVSIAVAGLFVYEPDLRATWVKPGIAQEDIPAGVNASIVFENVNVIPMDSERVLKGRTVVIQDQRIAVIGTSGEVDIPADAHVVDGDGKFLIPGLSDMHMHTFGSENDLLVYLANGVTTIRILGGDPPAILDWRDQIRAGTRVGPNIWAWWPMIENGYWGDPEWVKELQTRGGETYVHTPEDAEQLVAEMAALGVDGIKSHGVVSTDIFLALLEAAGKYGLPFDGHAPHDHANCPSNPDCVVDRSESWDDFRSMGAPALAHLEELAKMVDLVDVDTRQASDESIRQMAQDVADDGIWITTTIYLMRSIADQAADLEGALAAIPEVKYVHPSVFDTKKWGPGENYYVEVGSRPSWPGYLAAQEKLLPALNDSGGLLMSGTDASLALVVPGFSLHDELETMADVGLSPYDALKTSTINPARYLGESDEFGTVAKGKRADLVLLEGNPLEDITNTRLIAGTMVRGHWYSRADLDLMLEKVAEDYEVAAATQSVLEIAFPIVVVLLVALVWFVVRRRKASQVSS